MQNQGDKSSSGSIKRQASSTPSSEDSSSAEERGSPKRYQAAAVQSSAKRRSSPSEKAIEQRGSPTKRQRRMRPQIVVGMTAYSPDIPQVSTMIGRSAISPTQQLLAARRCSSEPCFDHVQPLTMDSMDSSDIKDELSRFASHAQNYAESRSPKQSVKVKSVPSATNDYGAKRHTSESKRSISQGYESPIKKRRLNNFQFKPVSPKANSSTRSVISSLRRMAINYSRQHQLHQLLNQSLAVVRHYHADYVCPELVGQFTPEELTQYFIGDDGISGKYIQPTLFFLEAVKKLSQYCQLEFPLKISPQVASQFLDCFLIKHNLKWIQTSDASMDESTLSLRQAATKLYDHFTALVKLSHAASRHWDDNVLGQISQFIFRLNVYSEAYDNYAKHQQKQAEKNEILIRSVDLEMRQIESNPILDKVKKYAEMAILQRALLDRYRCQVTPRQWADLLTSLRELSISWHPNWSKTPVLYDAAAAAIDPSALLNLYESRDYLDMIKRLLVDMTPNQTCSRANKKLFIMSQAIEAFPPVTLVVSEIQRFYNAVMNSNKVESKVGDETRLQQQFLKLQAYWYHQVSFIDTDRMLVADPDVPRDVLMKTGLQLKESGERLGYQFRDYSLLLNLLDTVKVFLVKRIKNKKQADYVQLYLNRQSLSERLYSFDADKKSFLMSIFTFIFNQFNLILSREQQHQLSSLILRLKQISELTDDLALLCAPSLELVMQHMDTFEKGQLKKALLVAPENIRQQQLAKFKKLIMKHIHQCDISLDELKPYCEKLFATLDLNQAFSQYAVDYLVRALFVDLITLPVLTRQHFFSYLILDYRRFMNYNRYFHDAVFRYVVISSLIMFCHQNHIDYTLSRPMALVQFLNEMLLQTTSSDDVIDLLVQSISTEKIDGVSLSLTMQQQQYLKQILLENSHPNHDCYQLAGKQLQRALAHLFKYGRADYSQFSSRNFIAVARQFCQSLVSLPILYQNHLQVYRRFLSPMLEQIQIRYWVRLISSNTIANALKLKAFLQAQYGLLLNIHRLFSHTSVVATALAVSLSYSHTLTLIQENDSIGSVGLDEVQQFLVDNPACKNKFQRLSLQEQIEFVKEHHKATAMNTISVNLLQLKDYLQRHQFFDLLGQEQQTPSKLIGVMIILMISFFRQHYFSVTPNQMQQYANLLKAIVLDQNHGGRHLYVSRFQRLLYNSFRRGQFLGVSRRDATFFPLQHFIKQVYDLGQSLLLLLPKRANEMVTPVVSAPYQMKSGF